MRKIIILILILLICTISCKKESINQTLPTKNNQNYKILETYIINGNLKQIDELLKESGNIDYYHGLNPLSNACYNNNIDVVKYLIKKGATTNPKRLDYDNSPLITACEKGNIDIVKILIENKANINDKVIYLDGGKGTPLSATAYNNSYIIAKYLLENGVNVEEINYALLCACSNNSIEVVKILLKYKADINYCGSVGWSGDMTPLMFAIGYKKYEIIDFLINNGADINLQSQENGLNSLMIATAVKDLKIIKFLINKGVDLNLQYYKSTFFLGQNLGEVPESGTSLILASIGGNKEIVQFLIEKGAKKYIKNKDNKIAYDYAIENNQSEILDILK